MAISPEPNAITRRCEWRKVADNEYRRPLFANELFLAVKSLFDGTCTMISSFTINGVTLSVVQNAWLKMAMLQPLVRMQLHRRHLQGRDDFEFSYKVPEDPNQVLQEWHNRTYRPCSKLSRHHLQEKAIQGRNELRPQRENGSSDVAHLYASQDSAGVHLVFSFQHAVTDARGQWMMIDQFLQLCSGELVGDPSTHRWGIDDVQRLPRPFHYVANLRKDGDVPPFDALDMIHKHIEADTHLVPFAGFPSIPTSVPSSAVSEMASIRYLSIKAEDYKLLHIEAKRHGCTASAWVGAILTVLLFELNAVDEMKTIRFPLQPVDARRYMPLESPPYFGVAIGGGDVDMKDLGTIAQAGSELCQPGGKIPESFWKVAQEYKEGLEKLASDRDSVLAAKEVLEAIYPYVLADPKIGDLSSVFYTSLGRARAYFKDVYSDSDSATQVKLEDLVTFPLFHNTLLLMCALLEFKGDLKIIYQIPANTHEQSFADGFSSRLEAIVARLVEGAKSTDTA